MNNKRKDKDPLFAEVKLTGEEFKQSPNNHAQRARFLKPGIGREIFQYAGTDGRGDLPSGKG